jgi:hypothetical protein
MPPTISVAHQSPGRLRVRIVGPRQDRFFFEKIADDLRRCPGIRHIEINPLTGSVLIHHASSLETIVEYGTNRDLFVLVPPNGRYAVPSRVAGEAIHALDSLLKRQTADSWNVRELAFLLLCGAGVVQAVHRNLWPAGVTLLWYASTFLPQEQGGQHRDRQPDRPLRS